MRRCDSVLTVVVLFAALASAPPASAQMQPASPAPPMQQLPPQAQPPAQATQSLTLQQAEKIAIQNHPQIQAASYLASAAKAQATEARSEYYPHAYGSATGVKSETNSRITAGTLNNPIVYDRFADGVAVQQLVTDFGRTHELVKSSLLHAKAQEENVTATRADILLAVDAAYYGVLKARLCCRSRRKPSRIANSFPIKSPRWKKTN